MPSINISSLKYNWRGQWTSGIRYVKNDIVQWNGASFACILDVPDEYEIALDTNIGTYTVNYGTTPNVLASYAAKVNNPELVLVDRRPDNVTYWKMVVRGSVFKRGWMPHRTYQIGDIVRYGGDLYMFSGSPGFGATATATVSNGQVASITVTSGGTGYTIAPSITISGNTIPPAVIGSPGIGAQAYATVSGGVITSIVITSGGTGYQTAPNIIINNQFVRNTCPEDSTYWTKVFENPNYDSRRMYAVASPNMQPLGWTRNNGDYPNPQTNEGNQVAFIDALGVPYTIGGCGSSNSYNTAGRGTRNWCVTWQPAGFTFVDWLRSTDNQTSLGLTGIAAGIGLPSPDGKPPRCIQWIKSTYQSVWLFNNGEVYFSGYNQNGEAGNSTPATTTIVYPVRCTNQATIGYLGETLQKSFNQTKIIKVDMPTVGSASSSNTSVYALGNDGSLWSWGYNGYGQLGHGQQTPGTATYGNPQIVPTRIPAVFFDNKKIVDFMCFGNEVTSVLAIDEDGDLWGWGADYQGELGLGASTAGGRDNRRPIPTRIPFDFKKFGGIKKMSYYHYSTTDVRAAFILTNDGSLFGAGYFYGGTSPLNQNSLGSGGNITRWTRFINTTANIKSIENFWVVGDRAYNIYIREKDTGLTYAMGDNLYGTLGSQSNTNYWWNSGGLSGTWSLVKGPRNIVHVTNPNANSATTGSVSYQSVILLEESGRAWAQGVNTRGSLSLGWTGQSSDSQMQNPETGGLNNMFQPVKMPAATRLATMMGQGTSGDDLCLYITDDGQALYCGTDGTAQTGVPNVQGAAGLRWYVANIAAPGSFNRSTMHSQPGD